MGGEREAASEIVTRQGPIRVLYHPVPFDAAPSLSIPYQPFLEEAIVQLDGYGRYKQAQILQKLREIDQEDRKRVVKLESIRAFWSRA